MWWRVPALAVLVASLAAPGTARGLDHVARLRDLPAPADGVVVIYDLDRPDSLAAVDAVGRGGGSAVLAVCVGTGCTAKAVARVAHRRGWTAVLAVDATGEEAQRRFGTAAPGPVGGGAGGLARAWRPPPRAAASPFGATLTPVAGTSVRGRAASAAWAGAGVASEVRVAAIVALPLLLLGLGGFVALGARRRRGEGAGDPEPEDERARMEWLIRQRHGRRRRQDL